jgi:hypothetical protein
MKPQFIPKHLKQLKTTTEKGTLPFMRVEWGVTETTQRPKILPDLPPKDKP